MRRPPAVKHPQHTASRLESASFFHDKIKLSSSNSCGRQHVDIDEQQEDRIWLIHIV